LGFAFGISMGEEYHNLYGGMDYSQSDETDSYFNLYFADMDRAMRRGSRRIFLGQTADEFKLRLGAQPEALYFHARAVNGFLNEGLKSAARWLFPPVKRMGVRNVFRGAAVARG